MLSVIPTWDVTVGTSFVTFLRLRLLTVDFKKFDKGDIFPTGKDEADGNNLDEGLEYMDGSVAGWKLKGEFNKLALDSKLFDFVNWKGKIPDGLSTNEPSNPFKVFFMILSSMLSAWLPKDNISLVFVKDGEGLEDKNGMFINVSEVGWSALFNFSMLAAIPSELEITILSGISIYSSGKPLQHHQL